MMNNNKSHESVVEFVENEQPSASRIAICGQFRGRGGDARVVEQQAIDLTEAGYEVAIFTLEADMDIPEGVRLQKVNPVQDYQLLSKLFWLLFSFSPWMLYTVWELRKFDLAITHRYPLTVASYVASITSNTVYTYWSHPSADTAGGFTGIAGVWSRIVHRFETESRTIAHADYICAVSKDSKRYLESHINRSAAVVPNKINERRFTEAVDGRYLRDQYGIRNDDQVVLFVGRITERKNVHSLINIIEDISSDVENLKLIVAGSASQKEYAKHVKNDAGPETIFTGYVSDEELAGLYSLADVFTTCSLEEGWGLPITEAQYFGTPVVAFKSHPAAKEVNEKVLVDVGDYEEFKRGILKYLD
ncbi:glycosyltransferase family 4 protein [Haloferax denitrificans]|uniref:glycosyltransferase family 4 protein n=1 Tax=Haloferax denitrificans TaxID=35745 RepID=UPI003C702553